MQNTNYKNKFSIKTPSDNSAWPPPQPMVGVGASSNSKKSFTLVELMIVIAILAILSAIVIFALNPSELFKKSRDSRRITDIQTLYKGISFMES